MSQTKGEDSEEEFQTFSEAVVANDIETISAILNRDDAGDFLITKNSTTELLPVHVAFVFRTARIEALRLVLDAAVERQVIRQMLHQQIGPERMSIIMFLVACSGDDCDASDDSDDDDSDDSDDDDDDEYEDCDSDEYEDAEEKFCQKQRHAKNQRLPLLELLLEYCEKHADFGKLLRSVDHKGNTVLHLATSRDCTVEMIKTLIAFFPFKELLREIMHAVNSDDSTPLALAQTEDIRDLLKEASEESESTLLRCKKWLAAKSDLSLQEFFEAIKTNRVDAIRDFLLKSSDETKVKTFLTSKDKKGYSAIHRVCIHHFDMGLFKLILSLAEKQGIIKNLLLMKVPEWDGGSAYYRFGYVDETDDDDDNDDDDDESSNVSNLFMFAVSCRNSNVERLHLICEYFNKHLDMNSFLQQPTNSYNGDNLLHWAASSRITDRALKLLIAQFPSEELFKKVLTMKNKSKETVIDLARRSSRERSEFFEDRNCWKLCRDLFESFDPSLTEMREKFSNVIFGGDARETNNMLNKFLQHPKAKQLVMSRDVETGLLPIHEIIREGFNKTAIRNVLECAVSLGIIKEMLEAKVVDTTYRNIIMVAVCCLESLTSGGGRSEKKEDGLRLLLDYCLKYANLPALLEEKIECSEDDDGGATTCLHMMATWVWKPHVAKIFISYFPSDDMFQRLLAVKDEDGDTPVDCAEDDGVKRLLRDRQCWKKCRANFNPYANNNNEASQDGDDNEQQQKQQQQAKVIKARKDLINAVKAQQEKRVFALLTDDNTMKEVLMLKSSAGYYPIHDVCFNGNPGNVTIQLIIDIAIKHGIIKQMLEAKVGKFAQNSLMYILGCCSGNISTETLYILLHACTNHADISKMLDEQDTEGRTCLHLAARSKVELIKVLIAYYPSQELFLKVVGVRNKSRKTFVDLVSNKEIKQLLQNPQECWNKCHNLLHDHSFVVSEGWDEVVRNLSEIDLRK